MWEPTLFHIYINYDKVLCEYISNSKVIWVVILMLLHYIYLNNVHLCKMHCPWTATSSFSYSYIWPQHIRDHQKAHLISRARDTKKKIKNPWPAWFGQKWYENVLFASLFIYCYLLAHLYSWDKAPQDLRSSCAHYITFWFFCTLHFIPFIKAFCSLLNNSDFVVSCCKRNQLSPHRRAKKNLLKMMLILTFVRPKEKQELRS